MWEEILKYELIMEICDADYTQPFNYIFAVHSNEICTVLLPQILSEHQWHHFHKTAWPFYNRLTHKCCLVVMFTGNDIIDNGQYRSQIQM